MKIDKINERIRVTFNIVTANKSIKDATVVFSKVPFEKGYQVFCYDCDFPELENFSAETWNQVKSKIIASEKDVENFRQGLENNWKYISEVIA